MKKPKQVDFNFIEAQTWLAILANFTETLLQILYPEVWALLKLLDFGGHKNLTNRIRNSNTNNTQLRSF